MIVSLDEIDMDDTIFVAVGKNVEESKTTLFWAVRNFVGKKISLLYIHQSSNVDKRLTADESRKGKSSEISQDFERDEVHDVLNQYNLILAQEGVESDALWIRTDNIEKGIVEIIAQYDVRWLVMGAAADKYYSKKQAKLKSKKAAFVCHHAPISCHIWFACKGRLIFTREGSYRTCEAEIDLPVLDPNANLETKQTDLLRLEYVEQVHLSQDADADEEVDKFNGTMQIYDYQQGVSSSQSTSSGRSTPKISPLLIEEEGKSQGRAVEKISCSLEEVIMDAKDCKQLAFEETMKRWKEEDDAMEAKCKAKALERLCIKEMSLRKEMEEALNKEKQEIEKTNNQLDEFRKDLQTIEQQKSILESQLVESHDTVKELEEKIISAVDLLIKFKERRDAMRVECETAEREVKMLKNSAKLKAAGFRWSKILEFSFMEINEGTQNFDPSWKIGEGRYGSVYKGVLRYANVAIKMLPSYGSKSQVSFCNGVEMLSRVRHPNLITLIGTCPESRSLVYEYVRNGSLEDRLACKDKTQPMTWQTRIRIAIEICSALIFLHSNRPIILHGNLKPSNVLLDTNFVCKLSDFGMLHLIPQSENAAILNTRYGKASSSSVAYIDPEYPETGILNPESDVYSFGLVLLCLLTARPVAGVVKDVKCALEKGNFKTVLDSIAGDWPIEQAKQLANLALKCCEKSRLNRPDLVSEIWGVLEPMRASFLDSSSSLVSKEVQKIPSHFMCPIFQEVMEDPHIAADGFTYDADAIKGWLKSGHNTSPMTNMKLEHCNLLPNHALHQAILEWKQRW